MTTGTKATDVTLHELVVSRASLVPDAPAVLSSTETLTYRGLVDRAGAIAAALRASGAGLEARVGIFLERGPDVLARFEGAAYLLPGAARSLPLEAAAAAALPAGPARVLVDVENGPSITAEVELPP